MSDQVQNMTSVAANATGDFAVGILGDFSKLMKDFNVIGFVLGLLIANGVAEIANSFIDGVLMPTVQPLLDKVSEKGAEIRVGGLTLNLEKFITALLKFFMVALVIFALLKLGVSMSKPVSWVRVVGNDPSADLS